MTAAALIALLLAQTLYAQDPLVPLRAQPKQRAAIVGQARINNALELLEVHKDWMQVRLGEVTGWVPSSKVAPAQQEWSALRVAAGLEAARSRSQIRLKIAALEKLAAINPLDQQISMALAEAYRLAGRPRAAAARERRDRGEGPSVVGACVDWGRVDQVVLLAAFEGGQWRSLVEDVEPAPAESDEGEGDGYFDWMPQVPRAAPTGPATAPSPAIDRMLLPYAELPMLRSVGGGAVLAPVSRLATPSWAHRTFYDVAFRAPSIGPCEELGLGEVVSAPATSTRPMPGEQERFDRLLAEKSERGRTVSVWSWFRAGFGEAGPLLGLGSFSHFGQSGYWLVALKPDGSVAELDIAVGFNE